MNQKPTIHETALQTGAWLLLGVTVIAVVWARIRLAGLPLERDEGEYAYSAQLLLHGIPPYQLAYSMKFPGTAAMYALLMSAFGESVEGIRIGLALVNLGTIALIFFLGRELLGKIGGAVTAASFSVLSLMPNVLGTAAHATHFVVLFAVGGVFALLRLRDRDSPLLTFVSGILFGLALLMKQPGLFFVLFGSLYLFSCDWRSGLGLKKILSRNLLFICGAAAPCFLMVLSLWGAGVFGKFWFWTIEYASQYGSQVSFRDGLRILTGHFCGVLGTAWPIWATAFLGVMTCVFNPAIRTRAGFLLTFAFFSALAVCPGFYFRPHYFILLLPAISLFAATAVTSVFEIRWIREGKLVFVVLLIFGICLAWPMWSEADFFFERPIAQANRLVNGINPFPESIKIAEYIRARSNPEDTIAVLGSEPQIYFYAKRHSATGYIYTYGLMEPQPYAHQMQLEMIHEIEAAQPKFLVLVVVNKSWLAGSDSDKTIFRWADAYCDANYEEVGLINISEEGTDYYFSGRPPSVALAADHILIYRLKT